MSIDPWREVRDAVRPSAAAGQLTDVRATQISTRYRVDVNDVRRVYAEEYIRLHPAAAEPDPVQASAPPAVTGDEPTPPADTPAICSASGCDDRGVTHGCGKHAGHGQLHRCDGGPHAAVVGSCGYMWSDPVTITGDTAVVETPTAAAKMGPETQPIYRATAIADDNAWLESEADDARTVGDDRANVDQAIACVAAIVDDNADGPIFTQACVVMQELSVLQDLIRQARQHADLIVERAVLAARIAEIDQALAPAADDEWESHLDQADDAPPPSQPTPEPGGGRAALGEAVDGPATMPTGELTPPVGGGRVDCPDCGREFYVNGLPRHRASCKKRRGAA